MDSELEAVAWQTGVWNRISDIYRSEIDRRFAQVVDGCIARAALEPGQVVLDLGTGTGTVALRAAAAVGPSGSVMAVDLSADMLELAGGRVKEAQLSNVELREGRAEDIPGSGCRVRRRRRLTQPHVRHRPAASSCRVCPRPPQWRPVRRRSLGGS